MTDRAVSLVRKASRGTVPRIPVVHYSHKQVNGGSEEVLARGFERQPFVLKSVSDLAHELQSVTRPWMLPSYSHLKQRG